MLHSLKILLFLAILSINCCLAQELRPAITQPIPVQELMGFENYPQVVQELIKKALPLTQQNLTYMYGSSDPKKGGMDCSGTIYYLLSNSNIGTIPRDSSDMYKWAWKNGKLYPATSHNFDSFEFDHLKPGDLLFWTGTYRVNRDPPISHVMIYLGKNKEGQRLMFGASDGRTYKNQQMWGVSVFDFKLPNGDSQSRFVGYSCIPKLTCNV